MVNTSLDWALTRNVHKTKQNRIYVIYDPPSLRKPCDQIPNTDTSLCAPGQHTGWEWNVGFTGFNLNADMALFKVS